MLILNRFLIEFTEQLLRYKITCAAAISPNPVITDEPKHQALPDDTVEAADLLVRVDSLVFAGEVFHAGCSTVSDLQMGH